MIPQADIDWSLKLNGSIRVGGSWGVPRSGLVFQKDSETDWSLKTVMPWSAGILKALLEGKDVPKDADALLAYQRADYECIRSRFEAAGLKISDPKNLLKI